MRPIRTLLVAVLACLAALALAAPGASADSTPAWVVSVAPAPAHLAPGGAGKLLVKAINVGGAPTSGTSTIEVKLPTGLTPTSAQLWPASLLPTCALTPPTVSCETSLPVRASQTIWMEVGVQVDPSPPAQALVGAAVSGGGGGEANSASDLTLQSGPSPFGFITPLIAPLTGEDGSAAILAASHPYQQSVSFEFPTQVLDDQYVGAGHARDVHLELPPGLIGNPSASPVLCTEAQLLSVGCPDESALGTIDITALIGDTSFGLSTTALYNMVPPPGYPAELATDVAGAGLYLHVLASVRSEGDYGVSIDARDLIAFARQPIFGSTSQVWGDPSSPLHDHARGTACVSDDGKSRCPVEPQPTAFWTLPARCDGNPLITEVSADSWEDPGVFAHATYESADLAGSPVSITDCGSLEFEPTIEAIPTTNLADSPSGLAFSLHQPQDTDKEHRSTPPLREAAVILPEGMVANPSQADGRGACSPAQIGLLGAQGIHFDKSPNSCPDASRLGTVKVTTPLLARRDADHKLELDPETKLPIPRVLEGSVYLAEPFANPFDSLLALYITVEDPPTGTVAKLAARVDPDPVTGQLTTTVSENPQLPLEDVRLHFFGGARASLISPPTCGAHTTTTALVPWSAPDTPSAHPTSNFQTTATPGGGECPSSADAAPNAPAFSAGTIGRTAGAYSPFVLKLSREDGSQRLTGFDTVLPPGLSGKLAGIPACPDSALAQAASRSNPEEGITERNSSSCPAASALGTVTVAAGAGPTPFHTTGTAYLAGPYRGAPLSMAVITPAIAGPFDLGVVVVRAALHLNPDSAQIHAVSDPFPTILHGIPLALRSVAVRLDRPDFTLNPTSCDPMAITGTATSVFGQTAPLSEPFQVGECPALPFKPRLSLRLKGPTKRTSHPKLIADLRAKPGEANIARTQVRLPRAAFLDNAHIKTICTRVQFAAEACPPGSVYGRATATTPLLDYPLTGPVHLRSSSNQLPDLVVKLEGPESQPLLIALAGRTDSVKGALRNTFEAVPDAPVSHFHLELFGGRRGLIELSAGLCRRPRASVQMDGQNGKTHDTNPVVKTSCPKKHKKHREHHHGGGR